MNCQVHWNLLLAGQVWHIEAIWFAALVYSIVGTGNLFDW